MATASAIATIVAVTRLRHLASARQAGPGIEELRGMRELYDVGRVAGLDVGERRIGVAVSDATGTLARPVGVLQTSGLEGDALERAVAELARLSAEDDGLV